MGASRRSSPQGGGAGCPDALWWILCCKNLDRRTRGKEATIHIGYGAEEIVFNAAAGFIHNTSYPGSSSMVSILSPACHPGGGTTAID